MNIQIYTVELASRVQTVFYPDIHISPFIHPRFHISHGLCVSRHRFSVVTHIAPACLRYLPRFCKPPRPASCRRQYEAFCILRLHRLFLPLHTQSIRSERLWYVSLVASIRENTRGYQRARSELSLKKAKHIYIFIQAISAFHRIYKSSSSKFNRFHPIESKHSLSVCFSH